MGDALVFKGSGVNTAGDPEVPVVDVIRGAGWNIWNWPGVDWTEGVKVGPTPGVLPAKPTGAPPGKVLVAVVGSVLEAVRLVLNGFIAAAAVLEFRFNVATPCSRPECNNRNRLNLRTIAHKTGSFSSASLEMGCQVTQVC